MSDEVIKQAKEFAESFSKVIARIDPIANSPITQNNAPIKVLADWARKALTLLQTVLAEQEARDKQIASLQAEIERYESEIAAVCPEDFSLQETLDAKQAEIERLKAALAAVEQQKEKK
jgi:septal ring factor EnvC (AmiA/AmiB activator)